PDRLALIVCVIDLWPAARSTSQDTRGQDETAWGRTTQPSHAFDMTFATIDLAPVAVVTRPVPACPDSRRSHADARSSLFGTACPGDAGSHSVWVDNGSVAVEVECQDRFGSRTDQAAPRSDLPLAPDIRPDLVSLIVEQVAVCQPVLTACHPICLRYAAHSG
ncbi:hypothetical protein BC831DRAFT_466989, partial [Entophlyctis helioformis]